MILLFLLCSLCLSLDPLNLNHDLRSQLIDTLCNTVFNYRLPRCRCIPLLPQTQMQLHVHCLLLLLFSLPILATTFLLIIHVSQLLEHLRDELDLVLKALDLDLAPRGPDVLLVLDDLQVAHLDVLLQLVQLVVVLLQQTQQLPIVVLGEVEVLVTLRQSVLELKRLAK